MTITEARAIAAAAGSHLFAIVERGRSAGTVMVPRRYAKGPHAGRFVVSSDRFKENQIGVDTIDEIIAYLHKGYSARLAPVGGGSPSLFGSASIHGWR